MAYKEPVFISEEKQVFKDVPVLKFIGNDAVVVFFEGRPEVASIMGKFRKYKLPLFSEKSNTPYFGTLDMYHINAYPGFTATVTKERMTKKDDFFEETAWILTAEDIKYERP